MPVAELEQINEEALFAFYEAQMTESQVGGGSGNGPIDIDPPGYGGQPERPEPEEEQTSALRRRGQVVLYFAQRVFTFRHLPEADSAYPSDRFKGPREHYDVPPAYWTQHSGA